MRFGPSGIRPGGEIGPGGVRSGESERGRFQNEAAQFPASAAQPRNKFRI